MPKFSLMILLAAEIRASANQFAPRGSAKRRKAKSPELRRSARRSRCPTILSANEAFCEITTDYVRTRARQFYL